MTEKPPQLCPTCGRDPKKVNSEWSECSHVECPSRKHDFAQPTGGMRERQPEPTIRNLFDDPEA